MVTVSVIVLNYNQIKLTIDCINSLLKQTYKDYEAIVVDNGSKDNSARILKEKFGNKIKLIALENNLGYCGGNNEGVKKCSKESKYIMILNNDTVVQKNLLSETVKSIESSEKIGAVTIPVFNRGFEKEAKKSLMEQRTHVSSLFMECISARIDKKINNNLFVFYPNGTCFLYRKEIMKFPFDYDYFAYGDEIYFGMLLRMKGYESVLCTKTWLRHENSAVKKSSNTKVVNYLKFLGRRNKLFNQLIFFRPLTLIKLLPLILVYNLLETIYDFRNIIARIKAVFYVLFHIPMILSKRKYIKEQRKVSDAELLEKMSYRLVSENDFKNPLLRLFGVVINCASYLYCKLLLLKTIEMKQNVVKKYGIIKIG